MSEFPTEFGYGRWQMPWGDVLLIQRSGEKCGEPYSHWLTTEEWPAVGYALNQCESATQKRDLFYKMVGNGVIHAA